jgi:hypothetical protein
LGLPSGPGSDTNCARANMIPLGNEAGVGGAVGSCGAGAAGASCSVPEPQAASAAAAIRVIRSAPVRAMVSSLGDMDPWM